MAHAVGPLVNPADPHPRLPGWVGDVIAAALIISAAFMPFPGAEFRPDDALSLVLVLAPAAVLPVRRRFPGPVLGLCLLFYGAAALTGTLAPGVVLATAVAMFGLTNRVPRGVGLVATGTAVVAMILLSLLAAIGSAWDPRAIQFAVTVAFAAAAGDATRSRRQYILAVTDRAERAERTREAEAKRRVSEERLRIARDLHDAVAHQISVISLNAGVASSALESRPEKAKEALGTIRSAARTVLGEIGDLLAVLRADEDDPESRSASPPAGLDRLEELLRQFSQAGLHVTVRVDGDPSALSGATDLVAYRVIQEGLTNAHKHGAQHRAHVLIDVDEDSARIVVTNPVSHPSTEDGGDRPEEPRFGGHGLLGLRERVASVRGTVETGPVPGGYRVTATLPLTKESPR